MVYGMCSQTVGVTLKLRQPWQVNSKSKVQFLVGGIVGAGVGALGGRVGGIVGGGGVIVNEFVAFP